MKQSTIEVSVIDLDVEPITAWPAVRTPVVAAGPAHAESEAQVVTAASQLGARISYFATRIWGQRPRPGSPGGVGERGLPWLERVRRETDLLVMTEVASARQVEQALAHHVDALWLGAETTADPRGVREIASALTGTQLPVLLTNPPSPDVGLWVSAIERLNRAGQRKLAAIYRGFQASDQRRFRSRPTWELAVELRETIPKLPLFCDVCRLAQEKSEIADVAQLALDHGFEGLRIEAHQSPSRAAGASHQITPDRADAILERLSQRDANTADADFNSRLGNLRERIDRIDMRVLDALTDRRRTVERIADLKRDKNIAPLQLKRWKALLDDRLARASALGLDPVNVKAIYEAIHEDSIRIQSEIMKRTRTKS